MEGKTIMTEPRYSTIRARPETKAIFARLRLRVSAEIGENITDGDFVKFLSLLGEKHFGQLIQIARDN